MSEHRDVFVFDVDALRAAFSVAAVKISAFFYEMCDATYKIALVKYLKEIGIPPGSDRTCRLRKKRRKEVMGYYYEEMINE